MPVQLTVQSVFLPQSSAHVPEPEQFIVQLPPAQLNFTALESLWFTVQLPPGHVAVSAPLPGASNVHFPFAHEKSHAPEPLHSISQLPPGQVRLQASAPVHAQGWPATHSLGSFASAVLPNRNTASRSTDGRMLAV